MNKHVLVKRILPGFESRLLVRRLINLPRDAFENFTGRRNPLTPPRGLWFVGGEENYKEVNEEYLGYCVKLGGLKPDHCVLDVGCGIGIVAARLTSYLNSDGSYFGFDIVHKGIEWAQKNISSRFPNFSFIHVDVFNKHYNPRGKLSPSSFRFPYADASFDFVLVKSVFTHLLPSSIQNYVREIGRVLKPSGRCLATAFLINEQSAELIDRGQSSLALTPHLEGCRVLDPEFPETAVGIPEAEFFQWWTAAGLTPELPIRYGSWSGRSQYLSYQDIVLTRGSGIANKCPAW